MLLITVPGTLAANLVTAFVVFAGLAVLRHLEYPPCPPSIRAAPVCATLPYRPSWPAIWSVTGGGLLIAACIFGVYLGLAWIDRRQGRKHARWSTWVPQLIGFLVHVAG
jgi:hypothetical protein